MGARQLTRPRRQIHCRLGRELMAGAHQSDRTKPAADPTGRTGACHHAMSDVHLPRSGASAACDACGALHRALVPHACRCLLRWLDQDALAKLVIDCAEADPTVFRELDLMAPTASKADCDDETLGRRIKRKILAAGSPLSGA